jgi:hypothetical protein
MQFLSTLLIFIPILNIDSQSISSNIPRFLIGYIRNSNSHRMKNIFGDCLRLPEELGSITLNEESIFLLNGNQHPFGLNQFPHSLIPFRKL